MKESNRTVAEMPTASPKGLAVLESKRLASLAMQCVVGVSIANGQDYVKLADAGGFSRQQVSEWARGIKSPSLENFLRLCKAAGVRIEISNALVEGMTVRI